MLNDSEASIVRQVTNLIYETTQLLHIYLTNYNKTVLYTCVTNDIEKRFYEHYFGLNQESSFTSKYKCFYLVWYERHQYVNHAIECEKEVKGWTRAKKINLLEQENPS